MSKNKPQAKVPTQNSQRAFAPLQPDGPVTPGALATVAMQVVDQLIAVQIAVQQHLIFRARGSQVPAAVVTEPDGTQRELPKKPLSDHVAEIARLVVRLEPLLDHFEPLLRASTHRTGRQEDPGIVQARFLAIGVLISDGIIKEHGRDETALCNALASNLSSDLTSLRATVLNEASSLIASEAEFERRVARSSHQRLAASQAILRAYVNAGDAGFETHADVAIAARVSEDTVRHLSPGWERSGVLHYDTKRKVRYITRDGRKLIADIDESAP